MDDRPELICRWAADHISDRDPVTNGDGWLGRCPDMLLQRDFYAARWRGRFNQRSKVVELAQPQLADQSPDGHATVCQVQLRANLSQWCVHPSVAISGTPVLVLGADVLWVKIFWAGDHCA